MDFSLSNVRGARAFLALLTLTAGAGALQAANSLVVTVSGGITCNVTTGPGASSATITVKAGTPNLVSPNTIVVTAPTVAGLTITPVNGTTLNSSNAGATTNTGITFTVTGSSNCGGVDGTIVSAAQFTGAGTGNVGAVTAGSVNVTDTVTSNDTLSAAITSGAVTCNVQTGPGGTATMTVTAGSAIPAGSSITVAPSLPQNANGLTVTAVSGNSLTSANWSSGITFTVASTTGCGGGSGAVSTQVAFTGTGIGSIAVVTASTAVSVTDTVTSSNVLVATVMGSITCSTTAGVGSPATVTITSFSSIGNSTIVVAASVGNAFTLTSPNNQTLSSSNTPLTYTVNAKPGCAGIGNQAPVSASIQFTAASVNDVVATVPATFTIGSSPLTVTPSSITLVCAYVPASGNNAATYTPQATAQTVSITSSVSGWPLAIDTSAGKTAPAWLSLVTTNLATTAGATATSFTVNGAAGCGGGANTTHSGTIYIANGGAADIAIPVTLQNEEANPLTVAPTTISLSYVKGSGAIASTNVTVSSTVAAAFITLNTASLPGWLTVDNITGVAPWAVHFSTTAVAASLAPGTYSASVQFQVAGYSPASLPVTLQVNNSAPKLSITCQGGVPVSECNPSTPTQISLNWTLGGAIPTYTITATSTDSPVQYAITTGGTLSPTLVNTSQESGLAYSFGTQIPVTFPSSVFATAQPGQVLTGTMTFTWGSPSSVTVITFLVTVQSPGSTLTSISPGTEPTASAGQTFTLTLTGTGFVGGSNANLATRIGIVSGGSIQPDTDLAINVTSPTTMILTITVPASGADATTFTSGGTMVLGIVNGNTSNIPTGQLSLTITNGPIIQAATSSSSFIEVNPGTAPTFAPYDLITLWGSAFCSGPAPGVTCGSNTILVGSPDAATLRYPTTVGPVSTDTQNRLVSVGFFQHGTNTSIANAPILFATNGQINLIVPAAVASYQTADIVVFFAPTGAAQPLKSSPFEVNIAQYDPGIFTIGSDGQGQGAALDINWNLITSSNPAGIRSGESDSDTIQIFVTGLGAPDANNGAGVTDSTPNYTWSTDCMPATGTGSYQTALQNSTGVTLTSIDGAVIQSSLLGAGILPPCFNSSSTPVSVTIGGVAATVTYAGFVSDTVAGLYQVNAKLPSSGSFNPAPTTAVQMPIVVSVGSGPTNSQAGVTLWVAPRLNVSASNLTNSTVTAVVGGAVDNLTTITATEGSGSYTYSLSAGALPVGLTFNSSTGLISGKPAAGSAGNYLVTVTATDTSTPPVTGSVTFTIIINPDLLTITSTTQASATAGTAVATLTTLTAAGGMSPYTFATTLSFTNSSGNVLETAPAGMAITNAGVISTSMSTMAGTYNVTATATDANGLNGFLTLPLSVALDVSQVAGSGATLNVVSTSGNSGTVTYALDSTSTGIGLGIDSSGNITANNGGKTTAPGNHTVTVTAADTVTLAPGAAGEGTGTLTFTVTVPSS